MRVAIAEDSGFFRAALVEAFNSADIEVSAEVDNAQKLLAAIATDAPDAVVVDICMPPTKTDEGLLAAKKIASEYPSVAVLVLSAFLSVNHVNRLLTDSRPGIGCMSKDHLDDVDCLIDAVVRLTKGEIVIDREFVAQRFSTDPTVQALAERESEILKLAAEGYSNLGIAQRLDISQKTVETALSSAFKKLNLESLHSKELNSRVCAVLAYLERPQSFVKIFDGR